jgi:hypothetical protein
VEEIKEEEEEDDNNNSGTSLLCHLRDTWHSHRKTATSTTAAQKEASRRYLTSFILILMVKQTKGRVE